MPYEIINSNRSKSIARVVGNTATLITLSQLSANSNNETITGAVISQVFSSSDGVWTIYRGNDATPANSTIVMQLFGENALPLTQADIAVANSATSNIYVTNSGTVGTLIIQLSKTATYLRDVDTGQLI
jgi:hypothetical protein